MFIILASLSWSLGRPECSTDVTAGNNPSPTSPQGVIKSTCAITGCDGCVTLLLMAVQASADSHRWRGGGS